MEKRSGRKPTYAVRLSKEDCEELKKVGDKKRTSATIRQRARPALRARRRRDDRADARRACAL